MCVCVCVCVSSQSSKDTLWLMLLPAPQHTWCRPTYDMEVQGATTECLNTLHTSTHSGRSHCFGLPMVGRAHVRRLEEGHFVMCEAWLMTSANCMLSCMTLCTNTEVLTHLQ